MLGFVTGGVQAFFSELSRSSSQGSQEVCIKIFGFLGRPVRDRPVVQEDLEVKLGEVGDVLGRSDGKVLPQQLLDGRQVRNSRVEELRR